MSSSLIASSHNKQAIFDADGMPFEEWLPVAGVHRARLPSAKRLVSTVREWSLHALHCANAAAGIALRARGCLYDCNVKRELGPSAGVLPEVYCHRDGWGLTACGLQSLDGD